MIRGSRAKEHDRGVSRRRQGESCVLSDGLYEWPLRQVTFWMCFTGIWWSVVCTVVCRTRVLRRWWGIFADSVSYANIFSYFNVSRCFLDYPVHLSRLGLSTEHIQFKVVVDVINWEYYVLKTSHGWSPSHETCSCSRSCHYSCITSKFPSRLSVLDVAMNWATVSMLSDMDLRCRPILCSWKL